MISDYLKLQKAGVNFKARCPFHNEKTSSFFVSPQRQIWHCFGCGVGGDIFGFIKQIEGVEFPEALRQLAAKAGVELEKFSATERETLGNKEQLYILCELAAKFYEKQLWHSAVGRQALDYLHDRGVSNDSIRAFRLGYAPDASNALKQFLDQSGYDKKDMLAAGLIGQAESGDRYYDRFRSRIMFPVLDLNGRVVGFSGRIFSAPGGSAFGGENPAKYINTPQTIIYDKSRLLYGLHLAKLDLRRKDRCLVMEGNLDVIMSHQAGFANAVASSGTALTDSQLRIIKRYTDNLDLCFDADAAGQSARDRGVELALAHGFNVGVLAIDEPGIKDPADYVQKHGRAWTDYATSNSRPFMEVYMRTVGKTHDLASAQGKKQVSQKLLPLIKILPNKIEQAHWLSELALLLKTSEQVLSQELAQTEFRSELVPESGISSAAVQIPSTTRSILSSLDPLEASLLSVVVKEPTLVQDLGLILTADLLSPSALSLFLAIKENSSEPFDRLVQKITDQTMLMPLEFAHLKAQELWKDFSKEELAVELARTVDQIKRRRAIARLTSLEFSIKEAEKNHDSDAVESLVTQFNEVMVQNKKYLSEPTSS